MNQNLENAMYQMEKLQSLAMAIEAGYLDCEIDPIDRQKAETGIGLYYALIDTVDSLKSELEKVYGDSKVCDVLDRVRKMKEEQGQ